MKLFGWEIGISKSAAAGLPSPADDYWYQPYAVGSSAGMRVTPDSALRLSAVYGAVRAISETVAMLLPILYERTGDGKQRAYSHPLYSVLYRKPNPWQTAYEFWEMMQGHLELRGNGYAQILPSNTGDPVGALIPLHPDRMRVERLPGNDFRLRYRFRNQDGTETIYSQDEIFHMRGFSLDGITGMSPISVEREVIGVGLGLQDYAARFIENDATPPGTLEHPGKLTPEARKNLKDSWQASQTGGNRHKTAVLEEGLKYNVVGITNKDAQFIEAREFQIEDIARIFRIPPHKIGHLKRSTFSNIEQQSIEFVQDCMLPRLKRIEQAISRDLLPADEQDQFFAEFNVDAIMRGDIAGRYAAYGSAILDGWMTRNEARAKENLNPLPGLDEPLEPMNMQQAGAKPDAAATKAAVDKEVNLVSKAWTDSPDEFVSYVNGYYGSMADGLVAKCRVSRSIAQDYTRRHRAEAIKAAESGAGQELEEIFASWAKNGAAELLAGVK